MKKLIGFYNPYCFLPHHFKIEKNNFSFDSFFLSFGDALSKLIEYYGLCDKTILLPDFYCPETAKTISEKMKIVFYKINSDFSVDKESYFEKIKNSSPDLIINYSFTGFALNDAEKEKLKLLTNDSTLIIDDCAHQNLKQNFQKIRLRHFAIDSIRKHSPFLGSHIIGLNNTTNGISGQWFNAYKFKCIFYQWLKNLCDLACTITGLETFNNLSDKFFLAQDDIIGTNPNPTKGCPTSFYLYNTVDWKKIYEHKKDMALIFSQELLTANLKGIKPLPIETAQKAEMNYLPIFIDKSKREELLDFLNERKIFADILWETSPESPKPLCNQGLYDSFIIYPLTWLVKKNDIISLVALLKQFSQKNES